MGDELRPRRVLVVLGAAHLHHFATFSREDVEEFFAPGNSGFFVADSNFLVDEEAAAPAVSGALGSEHWVRANQVEIGGQNVEQEVSGELFDGKNVDEQCAALESVEGEGGEDPLGGNYGGAEENDFWVFFAEVLWVGEEGDSEGLGRVGVVGARVGQDGVALADQGFGQKLPEVAETDDGDFEVLASLEMSCRQLRLIVEQLAGVHGSHAEGSAALKTEGSSGGFGRLRVVQRAERTERGFGWWR